MAEKLGLVAGKEQGRLREKLALVAVLSPSHQAPAVCQTLVGKARDGTTGRRVALREAEPLAASGHPQTLPAHAQDRLYLEVAGHLCPTREPRRNPDEHGYREAKALLAFSAHEVAEVSQARHEILHKILPAQITDRATFRPIFASVYQRARGAQAAEVLVVADGARWIWQMVAEVVPQAIQILDFSQVKHSLWRAGNLIYGAGAAFLTPWVKEHEALLLNEQVGQVIAPLQHFLALAPALDSIIQYFEHNVGRMRYGTDRQRGYFIGSGAIASAGKQLAVARLKGPGMRGQVKALNALLVLRCVFLEQSWPPYWQAPARRAA